MYSIPLKQFLSIIYIPGEHFFAAATLEGLLDLSFHTEQQSYIIVYGIFITK